jgi:hypothetical protein
MINESIHTSGDAANRFCSETETEWKPVSPSFPASSVAASADRKAKEAGRKSLHRD